MSTLISGSPSSFSRMPSGLRLWLIVVGTLLTMLLAACAGATDSQTIVRVSYDGPPPPGAEARLGRGAVNTVAFSPEEDAVVVGSDVGLFSYETGTLDDKWLVPSSHPVLSAAFSADGSLIVAGLSNGTVILIDALTGDTISQTGPSGSEVTAVAWSSGELDDEGALLAAGFNNGGVIVSRVSRTDDDLVLEALGTLPQDRSGITSLAYSPDGSMLASGVRTGLVSLWDAETAQPVRSLTGHDLGHAVLSMDWLPGNNTLVSASRDGQVIVWDSATGEPLQILTEHDDEVLSVVNAADEESVASVAADGTVIVWNAVNGSPRRTLDGIAGDGAYASVSPSGSMLVMAAEDGRLGIWDITATTSNQPLATLEGHTPRGSAVAGVAWSPDGEWVAAGSGSRVLVWGVDGAQTPQILEGHRGAVVSVAWSPDGTSLASGSRDGTVGVWDVETGERQLTLEGHSGHVWNVAWSPDGTSVAGTGGIDDMLLIWDTGSGDLLHTINGSGSGTWAVEWSPDGNRLVTGLGFGELVMWDMTDAATDTPIDVMRGHLNWVSSLTWSPDGEMLVSGAADNRLFLWDGATGDRLGVRAGHANAILDVAFSPDGTRLASASLDKLVIVWDAVGDMDLPLPGHTDGVTGVAWSPDGATLASGSSDGTVILWEVGPP